MAKKQQSKAIGFLQRDIFALIWIALIIILGLLTIYWSHLIYELITVSILFLFFFLLEPVIKMSHGSKFARTISGGQYVPPWKRFPIFFLAIVIVFEIKHYLEKYLYDAFPPGSVSIVLVIFWFIALFSIYYLLLVQRSGNGSSDRPTRKRSTKEK